MNHKLTLSAVGIAAGLAATLLATPILAQRNQGRERGGGEDRPSRQCMQEVMALCDQRGRPDRSQIRSCLQEKGDELSDQCASEFQQRRAARGNREGAQPYQRAVKPTRTVFYGSDPRQQVDVYEPKGAVDELPLVFYIHGGAWRMGDHRYIHTKPAFFSRSEIYFASTGYRILPQSPVEEQAGDVGLALQALIGQAKTLGFDPSRIVLMGHSSGAHLAALVATDPHYAGDAFAAIKGVVLLDGAGFDIPKTMASAPPATRRIYEYAFGLEVERQTALSPLSHVGGRDAPHWLALYDEARAASKVQGELFMARLVEAGHQAKAVAIADTDHRRITREMGSEAGKAQTQAVEAFLKDVF